jgi:uncharacterized RDD family membrane protein YckC
MARSFGSWLSGPPPSGPGDPTHGDYPGQRLGLPERGSRSIARFGRRLGALLIDWLIGYGLAGLAIALGWVPSAALSTAVLVVWLVLGVVAVRLFGFTPGQYVVGLTVASVDGRDHVGWGRALGRGLLITLVIPALFTDADHRGLHDLATKTAVIRR